MLARAGLQTGVGVKALVKRIPSRASRSMLGVGACELPEAPNAHGPWSSAMMKRMLGRAPAGGAPRPAVGRLSRRRVVSASGNVFIMEGLAISSGCSDDALVRF